MQMKMYNGPILCRASQSHDHHIFKMEIPVTGKTVFILVLMLNPVYVLTEITVNSLI